MNIDLSSTTSIPATRATSTGPIPNGTVAKKMTTEEATASMAVSVNAVVASDLLDKANRFIQAEHLEPFTGYDKGTVSKGAFLDVEKYNNYIFDKAASGMVTDAAKSGITLKKEDVLQTLKAANNGIASIKNDNASRVAALGSPSVYTDLSPSDMSSLTDTYIRAQEAGLDTSQVGGIAVRMGLANRDAKNGVKTSVYDPAKEAANIPYDDTMQKVSSKSSDKLDQLKNALYGKLGMPTEMINILVDSYGVGNTEAAATLAFVKAVIASGSTSNIN